MIFGKEIDDILYSYYKQHSFITLGSIISSIITFTLESVFVPKLMSKIMTNIKDLSLLKDNILKLLGTWTITQIAYSITEKINSNVEPTLTKFITDNIIENIFKKYEVTNKNINSTSIFTRILSLRLNIEILVNRIFITILPRFIGISIILFNFFLINKKLFFTSLFVIFIQCYVIFSKLNNCVELSFNEVEDKDELMKLITDKFDNIHIINGTKDGILSEIEKCKEGTAKIKNKRIEAIDCVINKQIQGYFSNIFIFGVIMLYSYVLYSNNEISSEDISTIMLSINSMFSHIYEITYHIPIVTARMGILNSDNKFVKEIFHYKSKGGDDIVIDKGNIKFVNVSFNYNNDNNDNNKDKAVIENITTELNNGINMIYGPSGSGKTTFVNLISDVIQPTKGDIYIDGHNLKDISKSSIKKYILYITQNMSTLFNDTIYNNIAYQNNNISKEMIIKLIDKYNLNEIFKNIMNNNNDFLNIVVGKKGELLSGGQKQIIHIIRAMFNDDIKILILDEPTSALDSKSKENVINMIKKYYNNKTIIIISHDKEVIKYGDKLIEFK